MVQRRPFRVRILLRLPAAALLAISLGVLAAAPAWAHAGEPVAPHDLWGAWEFSPPIVLALLYLGAAYTLGVTNAWRTAGSGRVVSRRQVWAFAGGFVLLALALVSPIDPMGGALFSAHMVQHILLMMMAAPLLALGAPPVVWLWCLPLQWRRGLAHRWRRQGLWRGLAHLLGLPLTVWLLSTLALWLWHAPQLYEAALTDDLVHALEHVSFLASAWLFWGVVYALVGRSGAGDGTAILLLFTTAMQSGILGALITFARTPWYPSYAATTAPWGLTPLADQQLAGVIMWVPAGLVYLVATLAILGRRLALLERAGASQAAGAAEARSVAHPSVRPAAPTVPPALLLPALLGLATVLGGCTGEVWALETPRRAAPVVPNGVPAVGAVALRAYGCGSCHNIPGVTGADSGVGPPLDRWAERHYIAGTLLNTPDNLIRWIREPQAIEPGTAMPNLGVSEEDARHMSAYLYTLQR